MLLKNYRCENKETKIQNERILLHFIKELENINEMKSRNQYINTKN